MEKNFDTFVEAFLKARDLSQLSENPFVVITFINSRGSAPQDAGSRIIANAHEIIFGTIGGGKLEAKALAEARSRLEMATEPFSLTWNLQKDVGMTCGGEVTLFFEFHSPKKRWPIAIFGAGHVAQELVQTLLRLDCFITVFEHRKDWLDKIPLSSKIEKVLVASPEGENKGSYAEQVKNLAPHSFVVTMTMGHATDLPIIDAALKKDFPYVGAIGSETKANKIRHELKGFGHPDQKIQSLKCPIGEPIGSNAPAEIALSVAAQLLRLRS